MKKRLLIIVSIVLVLGVVGVGAVWLLNHKDHDADVLVMRGDDCNIDWSRAYGGNPSNINPELARRLCLLAEQTGTRIIPNAGFRTSDEQWQLGEEMLRSTEGRVMGYYRDENGAVRDSQGRLMAEAPGDSQHETGDAVDVNRDGRDGHFYSREELARAGLTNQNTNRSSVYGPGNPALKKSEPWHVTLDIDNTE